MLELIHRIWPPDTADQGPPRLTTPQVKPTLIEDAMRGAEWMALCLAESGYNPDFTLNSLRDLDTFIDEHSKDGNPKPGGLLSECVGMRLFGLGCYLGEVLRREYGGEWVSHDDNEIDIQIVFPRGGVIWPVQKTMKRFRNGPEDGLYVYGLALATWVSQSEVSPLDCT